MLRIHQAHVVDFPFPTTMTPGTILSLDKNGLLVATGKQALMVDILQFPGAKAMPVADWLNAGRRQLHTQLILQ